MGASTYFQAQGLRIIHWNLEGMAGKAVKQFLDDLEKEHPFDVLLCNEFCSVEECVRSAQRYEIVCGPGQRGQSQVWQIADVRIEDVTVCPARLAECSPISASGGTADKWFLFRMRLSHVQAEYLDSGRLRCDEIEYKDYDILMTYQTGSVSWIRFLTSYNSDIFCWTENVVR